MKKVLTGFSLWVAFMALPLAVPAADTGPTTTPTTEKLSTPSLEERVADLEAYLNNGARGNAANPSLTTKVGGPGPGHNAFQMICAALVLFMTLPGLALFYGGLVRRKNVLSVLAQCLGIAGLVSILWWMCGYSLAFSKDGFIHGLVGNLDWKFMAGVGSEPNTDYSAWVSHNVYSMFQLMFAIITPALMVGAIAERMRYSAILLFVALWMFVVYFPLAHMVWGADGLMNGVWNPVAKIRAIDFAGGTVVHMSSGWSALVLCLVLGKRLGFGKEPMPPHSMVLCMVGTGMLWVGWYGFNAGSAVAADGIAANAFTTTTLATAVASFTWAMAEYVFRGKPSILGFCSGAVAGLVVVTPACGYVTTTGAVVIGLVAGLVPYLACWKLKSAAGYDDALDTFGVHAVGGTLGAFLTGLLASAKANPNLVNNLAKVGNKLDAANPATRNGLARLVAEGGLWIEQLKAIGITLCLAIVGTIIITFVVRAILGLRVAPEIEVSGLDLSEHGEEGYHTAGQL
ncbi:MAG TPA: ammonium transporter [Candidatus Paceibacterota bacterium]|nr:ammonium transporter [Verrucomicrobiota bacterium]HSA10221.1 ammonium transporter [Candidatus Paceibacterota bacterium]